VEAGGVQQGGCILLPNHSPAPEAEGKRLLLVPADEEGGRVATHSRPSCHMFYVDEGWSATTQSSPKQSKTIQNTAMLQARET